MPLSERNAPIYHTAGRCTVCRLFAPLPDSEWQAVERWRATGSSWEQIADEINDEYGTNFRGETVSRHARGRCRPDPQPDPLLRPLVERHVPARP